MTEVKLITLDPGHFHAALIQKEMYPEVARRAAVYAPLGPDLIDHLQRISRFNQREKNPTVWELDVHTGPDFLERMIAERAGNVVVISGRNRRKIELIQASVNAGLHVLADKPWIVNPADLPKLEATLAGAAAQRTIAYDIMTERYEITSILQRELVNDPDVFGRPVSVYMESVHHIMKLVAGVPLQRPPWFFDVEEQGAALADVGTHLVDLVQWELFPYQAIDVNDIAVKQTKRWPTKITAENFRKITGQTRAQDLDYDTNTQIEYEIRGVPVKMDVLWNWEAPPGTGDTHVAQFIGTKASVDIRQGAVENYRPELYVVGGRPKAVYARIADLQDRWPGVKAVDAGREIRVEIPDVYRVGHEAHFAQVTRQFFEYLQDPGKLPAWEAPDMLAKYTVSTASFR